jgi:hypothetical protein
MQTVSPRALQIVRTLTGVDIASLRAWWRGPEPSEPELGGPRGNQRLTALTGMLVLPLAALVLLTGLLFGSLWRVHFFVGYLLLPVAVLKVCTTTYRMARYYLRSGAYRRIRPPYPLSRLTSPLLVICTVLLFVSGIVMWATHWQRDPWGWLHTDAAIAFSVIVALHLGVYLPEAVRAAQEQLVPAPHAREPERRTRLLVVTAVGVAGLVLAIATLGFGQLPARAHRHERGGAVAPLDKGSRLMRKR